MDKNFPSPASLVADVLLEWPQVIPVFLKHRMGCVGCTMSSFNTLSDVTRIYQLPAEPFMDELLAAIRLVEGGEIPKS